VAFLVEARGGFPDETVGFFPEADAGVELDVEVEVALEIDGLERFEGGLVDGGEGGDVGVLNGL
jgi:hypothetical protein